MANLVKFVLVFLYSSFSTILAVTTVVIAIGTSDNWVSGQKGTLLGISAVLSLVCLAIGWLTYKTEVSN